jgi:hypothetical protein
LLFIVLTSLFTILTTRTTNKNTSISPSGSVEYEELLFSYFLLCAVQSRMPKTVKSLAVEENEKEREKIQFL